MTFEAIPVRLLLLSGGSLVGQNLLQVLQGERRHFHVIATNSVVEEPVLQDFDEVHVVPQTGHDPQRLTEIIERLIQECSPALIIPCRDEDVLFLARLCEAREDLARRIPCGISSIAEALLDKWVSWQFSHEHDLPFAPTCLLSEDDATLERFAEQYGYPLVLKPRMGFASRNVTIALNRNQLLAAPDRDTRLAQAYIGDFSAVTKYTEESARDGWPLFHSFEEQKFSIQLMLDPAGELAGMMTTIHTMRRGMSVAVEIDKSPDSASLGQRCAHVFGKRGWRGPLNIQCQRHTDGTLHIYEYNGRFTGATAARAKLGYDELRLALSVFANLDLPTQETRPAKRVFTRNVSRSLPHDIETTLHQTGSFRSSGSRSGLMEVVVPPPLVSVVVTTYQHGRYIAECLQSILDQQTTFPFEIIIGEDESTDGTRKICEDFARRYPKQIRLFLRSRAETTSAIPGSKKSVNGILTRAEARGPFVSQCDGDDYWIDRHKLEKQVAYLRTNANCALCFHSVSVIGEVNGARDSYSYDPPNGKRFYGVDDLLRHECFILASTVMYRNDKPIPNPGWLLSVPFRDFPLRVLQLSDNERPFAGYLPDRMTAYRRHAGGVWTGRSAMRKVQDYVTIYEILGRELGLNQRPEWKLRMSELLFKLAWVSCRSGNLIPFIAALRQNLLTANPLFMAFVAQQRGMKCVSQVFRPARERENRGKEEIE